MKKKDTLLEPFAEYKLRGAVQFSIIGGMDKAPTW
jgi:hypothetical protein